MGACQCLNRRQWFGKVNKLLGKGQPNWYGCLSMLN
jgi:hypothetical protein